MPLNSLTMAILNPFQLLEINIISAQDLEMSSKKMRTYATAWVNPSRKLTTRVDNEGQNNPTWNDKFVFRVDDLFLRQDTSAVMIELYGVHWFRDTLIGTVRVLVGNLIPPPIRSHHQNHHIGMRFVALQVRRPSGRPQGILNIGVTLLDSSMRSMPLYTQVCKSAVGYRDLMGEEDSHLQYNNNYDNKNRDLKEKNVNAVPVVKPILLRSKSERSAAFDNVSLHNSSIVAIPQKRGVFLEESSILSITDAGSTFMKRKAGKASSVISGAELRKKPKHKGNRKGKASSVLSDSIVSKDSATFNVKNETPKTKPKPKRKLLPLPKEHELDNDAEEKKEAPKLDQSPTNKVVDEKSLMKSKLPAKPIGKSTPKYIGYDHGGQKTNGKFVLGGPTKENSIWSDSEVGPSPSEVAAAMADRKYPIEDRSVLSDSWSMDESVEGLRSKLERWRTELPPIYDRGFSSSYRSTSTSQRPARRHSDGGSGLFSCFGNICGIECQCVCGKPPGRKTSGAKFHQSSSVGSRSYL